MSGTSSSSTRNKRARRGAMVRDAIAEAAERLGGGEALALWVQKDEKNAEKFWTTLYPKLLALPDDNVDDGQVSIAAAIEAARKRVREGRAADERNKGKP